MSRNLLSTQTARGSLLSLAAVVFLVALNNGGKGILERRYPSHREDIADVVMILNVIGGLFGLDGTVTSLQGRARATKDVYTWQGLPGRNKEDCDDA